MRELKTGQYYYCPTCNDFFIETSVKFESFLQSLNNTFSGCTKYCTNGHLINSNNEDFVFLDDKPERFINSCIICIDCKDFSEFPDSTQYAIQSILYQITQKVDSINDKRLIYKGTGDGYIAGIKNGKTDDAIEYCKKIINDYISKCPVIKYRIGIVYGTFFTYWGIGSIKDLFGPDVIKACRIADFGNQNIILLSKEAKDNTIKKENLDNLLDIGNCIDKHRRPHYLYSFQDENVGSDFYA